MFNSYVNAPNYGDERAFFDAKPAGNQEPGGYRDVVQVSAGDRITIRVYVNNNADTQTASDTSLMILLPKQLQRAQVAAASITASNAEPETISDTVTFRSAEQFQLVFEKNSAPQVTYRPNGTGEFTTKDLVSAQFPSSSTLRAHLGLWRPGFGNGALITATIRVV